MTKENREQRRADESILSLLTPEQRQQVREWLAEAQSPELDDD
jgi:Spy/CpxP family protein refolding chaperone